jgi:hypothetical protein
VLFSLPLREIQNCAVLRRISSEKNFNGEETASKKEYLDRARLLRGPGIDLLDDDRCAFARFCHRKKGDAWELTEKSATDENRSEAIKAASDCPAGRLTAVDKDGTEIEPVLEPSIDIIQDPQKGVSSGIFVKGRILLNRLTELFMRQETASCFAAVANPEINPFVMRPTYTQDFRTNKHGHQYFEAALKLHL